MNLPRFAVDPETLDLLDLAIDPPPCPACHGVEGGCEGCNWRGYAVSLRSVLEALSFDSTREYDVGDVIGALVAEVRRLRSAARSFAQSASPAPTGHPARVVALSAATGAVLGAYVGWRLAGRRA